MISNMFMANTSTASLPELPSYTLSLKPPLIPGIPDVASQVLSPIIAYWIVSLFFHILDVYDLCAQWRLHTPAEVLKRNHVTRYEVLRDVIVQQIFQTMFGLTVGYFDPPEMIGKEQYDIAVWAQRLRMAQIQLPSVLALLGLNAPKMAMKLDAYPTLSSILAGGQYASEGFASWEMISAKTIYYVIVPLIQFFVAVVMLDTWQYFLHRGMHMNKFLYTTLHSRHHRLYVPYAFGALYNHPVEGFILDTLGAGTAYLATRMTVLQGLVFYTCCTIKTVDDHCGYAFPWDPLQHITSNNAAYHDVHHQSWGIKSNFSQPFSTFWDRLLGTTWKGGDISVRYERDRISAQRKVDADAATGFTSVTNSPAIDLTETKKQAAEGQKQVLDTDGPSVLQEERREEQDVKRSMRRSPRRKTGTFDPRSSLSERVPSLYGSRTPILHADGMH